MRESERIWTLGYGVDTDMLAGQFVPPLLHGNHPTTKRLPVSELKMSMVIESGEMALIVGSIMAVIGSLLAPTDHLNLLMKAVLDLMPWTKDPTF